MPKPEQQSLFLRTPDERQAGLDAVRGIKGNLSSMISDRPRFTPAGPADPRFMGTEQRKRMGAESSHMSMVPNVDPNPSNPNACMYCGTEHHPDDPAGCGY